MKPEKKFELLSNYLDENGRYNPMKSEDRRRKLFPIKKDHTDRAELYNKNPIYKSHDYREYITKRRNVLANRSEHLFIKMGFGY